MSLKSRGINAERDLVHKFCDAGWSAMRAAGSGNQKNPCPDVLAGRRGFIFAIECKISEGDSKYIPREELAELKRFADIMGIVPLVAVRFKQKHWRFYPLGMLEYTKKFGVAKIDADYKSLKYILQLGDIIGLGERSD